MAVCAYLDEVLDALEEGDGGVCAERWYSKEAFAGWWERCKGEVVDGRDWTDVVSPYAM